MVEIELRPSVETDREFLFELHRATLKEYVAATYGWQDDTQRQMFNRSFTPGRDEIISFAGEDVGMVRFFDADRAVFISLIEILPAFQGKGIGTALLGRIIRDAHARDLPVRLQVFRVNTAARRLYERLGFTHTGETKTHHQMEKALKAGR
jgi:RimJ/RimL family protein N-acetyltransferase